jgi:hypothetical protein
LADVFHPRIYKRKKEKKTKKAQKSVLSFTLTWSMGPKIMPDGGYLGISFLSTEAATALCQPTAKIELSYVILTSLEVL